MKAGDKSRAVCPKCKDIVPTTMKYLPLKYGKIGTIPNILQGVCDWCGTSVGIPHSEPKKIRAFLEKHVPKDQLDIHNPKSRDLYKEAIEKAFKKDTIIKCPDLKGPAEVVHQDGSVFKFYNAVFVQEGKFLIVYSEHMHPLVFFREDLESFKYLKKRRTHA